jgi:hypothetical protein
MSVQAIIKAIKGEKCLPFLGAGASAGYTANGRVVPGIPLGGQLAEQLATACDYRNGTTYDLASVAEYYVYVKNGNRGALEDWISAQIAPISEPRPVQTVLAQIPEVKYMITSNYDGLLEAAIQACQRRLKRHVHRRTHPRAGHLEFNPFIRHPEIAILKMHGTVEEPKTMVITQSDYIRYLAHLDHPDRGMPDFFRKTLIPNSHLLFLGYSLSDWNFRVIWEGVLASYRESGESAPETILDAFAILKLPEDCQKAEFLRSFWSKRNITLIDCDLTDFSRELAREFDLEIPQLGIMKTAPAVQGGVSP